MDDVIPVWRKSTKSGSESCVEVAVSAPESVLIRDSKNPHGAVLTFDVVVFRQFIDFVKESSR
nr:DUF397 domain-containing protein [Actinoplanes sp. TFC3]